MVDGGEVEVLDVFGHGGGHVLSLAGSDDCANVELCMWGRLLARVRGFCAASRLLMKMAPLPWLGSTMHCISSCHEPSVRFIEDYLL